MLRACLTALPQVMCTSKHATSFHSPVFRGHQSFREELPQPGQSEPALLLPTAEKVSLDQAPHNVQLTAKSRSRSREGGRGLIAMQGRDDSNLDPSIRAT